MKRARIFCLLACVIVACLTLVQPVSAFSASPPTPATDAVTKATQKPLAQALTAEQATKLLQDKKYISAQPTHPGELDTQVDNTQFYGFSYDDGERFSYVWVNAATGGVVFADEIENYTGEGDSANTASMNKEKLVEYLLASVPEAKERTTRESLTPRVTEETTMLNTGMCRDVQLGKEAGTAFKPAIIYTISPFGSVYQYLPENASWTAVYVKPDN